MPCHAVTMPRCAVALKSRFQNGMVWYGTGAALHVSINHGRTV
jgi:hypothetical protein